MYKIIGADNREYSSLTADQIRQWIGERRVNAQTLVQVEGTTDWRPLGSLPEFAQALGPPPVPTPAPPPAAPQASQKIAAGICGILLGSLGIHKFILGYTGAGLIMLLVTLLTCGLGWVVMWVIGLIEGVLYLTKSDEEFVRTYVEGRKEWF